MTEKTAVSDNHWKLARPYHLSWSRFGRKLETPSGIAPLTSVRSGKAPPPQGAVEVSIPILVVAKRKQIQFIDFKSINAGKQLQRTDRRKRRDEIPPRSLICINNIAIRFCSIQRRRGKQRIARHALTKPPNLHFISNGYPGAGSDDRVTEDIQISWHVVMWLYPYRISMRIYKQIVVKSDVPLSLQ